MSNIWNVLSKIGFELHPDRIEYMVKKIENISSYKDLLTASFKTGLNINEKMLRDLLDAWAKEPHVSPKEVAAALKSASVTALYSNMRNGTVELVWTGPDTGLVPIRHTEQVLQEVIDSAEDRIFLVSFVAYELPNIISALQRAIKRNVKVDILLEISKEQGGRVNHDSIKKMKENIPVANLYVWNQMNNYKPVSGAVHTKCAVSDGKFAFITSANLTRAAMEWNMELGVFIKGGKIPDKLEKHLDALIDTEVIILCK